MAATTEKDGTKSLSPKDLLRTTIQQELEKREVVDYIERKRPLMGLFIPAPSYPPVAITADRFLTVGLPRLGFLVITALLICLGVVLTLSYLQLWTACCIFLPPTLYGGYRRYRQRTATTAKTNLHGDPDEWSLRCHEFFDINTPGAIDRRRKIVEETIAAVDAKAAKKFNEYVRSVDALAIYGCGILAATHVGGLRALERHGMETKNLKTLAGVSAGSVVAAMLSVGCSADEIFDLVQKLPFYKIALPELGALVRVLGNVVQSVLRATMGSHAAEVVECLVAGDTGPGINSGSCLEEMIGNALKERCGDAAITLKAVQDRFGKRLVILACELDSGHEKRFTPESDPDLPVRVAVRMSMGVPGLMEPFRYKGHVYCDGGMCNDFPVDALPEDAKRMGLMVRPVDWIRHHIPGLSTIIPDEKLKKHPDVMAHLNEHMQKMPTLFSVKSILDLALTSVNIMMDANLVLQIEAATAKKGFRQNSGISGLAPEILTLCGGRYDPFDFNLTKEQHRELFLAGQLSTHLHASIVDESSQVLSDEGKLKTMLYTLHMDYPKIP
ncbi:unnamed protein product [Symbiodinium natans]|uniref:PNPLA domain-containing protein n=1 Tax=Symbiodinium natans TaxID=878477 RepID=A0A812T1V8_9DINO|nr:unnamed protein product [Symbiodinium natans]